MTKINLVTQLQKRLHFDGTLTATQQTILHNLIDRASRSPRFWRVVLVGRDGVGKTFLARMGVVKFPGGSAKGYGNVVII